MDNSNKKLENQINDVCLKTNQIDLSGNGVKERPCKKRQWVSKELREQILKRDNYCCRMFLSDKDVEIHEITPQSLGGELSYENCITVCYRCHLYLHNAKYFKLLNKKTTKEGLRKARMRGKKLGRPKGSKDLSPRKRDGYIRRWVNYRK